MDVLPQLIASGIVLGGIYALVSVGLTLIFGVMRIVNFAHGEFLMLSMYLAIGLYRRARPRSLRRPAGRDPAVARCSARWSTSA